MPLDKLFEVVKVPELDNLPPCTDGIALPIEPAGKVSVDESNVSNDDSDTGGAPEEPTVEEEESDDEESE